MAILDTMAILLKTGEWTEKQHTVIYQWDCLSSWLTLDFLRWWLVGKYTAYVDHEFCVCMYNTMCVYVCITPCNSLLPSRTVCCLAHRSLVLSLRPSAFSWTEQWVLLVSSTTRCGAKEDLLNASDSVCRKWVGMFSVCTTWISRLEIVMLRKPEYRRK